MNPVEMALQTWRDQKLRYNKQINLVISELSKPLKLIPSPQYQSKLEELKQYLKYSYTYEEDEGFYEIYVHHVAGVVNLSLMELANRIVEALGGPISFWQNKILDLATLVNYHPDISIWEVNRFYQSYMGLSPEFTNFLRKKRSLAKNYLFSLTSLCKIIDKCKASQEDLLKIDQSYKRLKKAEERYYAFMQEMEQAGGNVNELTLSTKGKNNAKNTLFMFLKNKEPKVNTLMKYNFRVGKEESEIQSKLLKGKEYEDLEQLVNSLMKTTKSQRQSIYSDTSQSRLPLESKKQSSVTIEQLRDQFKATLGRAKIGKLQLQEGHHTYIWSKQYFFTYWGFPVKHKPEIDYTQPFRLYEQIVYDIDSQEEFDELNAEDLENDDEMSEESSVSQAGSFVVGDDYRSEQEEEKEDMKGCQAANTRDSWQKQGHELKDYEIICLYPEQNLPLCLQEDLLNFDQKLVEKINGKGRNEIMAIFQAEKKEVSKSRIDSLLKNNFRKIKNKSKQIVYVRNDQTQTAGKVVEVIPLDGFSDPQTTSQNYEISISYASKSKSKKPQYDPNLTILQEPPFSSQ